MNFTKASQNTHSKSMPKCIRQYKNDFSGRLFQARLLLAD